MSKTQYFRQYTYAAIKVAHKDSIDTYLYNPSEQSVLDFILEQGWKKNLDNTPTMESSKEMC